MCMIKNPKNNESVFLFGVFIAFSDTLIPTNNGAWYLIRNLNGSYDHGYIYDYNHPLVEGEWLRAARTIIPSPFPEEKESVLYFGGYDSGGSPNHNTALIYKAKITNNTRPNIPDISGPKSGKPGIKYEFHFNSTDIDNDNIYYYVDWGDGDKEEWIGPFSSGESIKINHTWDSKGGFAIRVKVKDTNGAESNWGTLKINMMKSIDIHYRWYNIHQEIIRNFYIKNLN